MLVPNDIYFRVSRKWWFLATRSAAYLRYVSTGSARNYHLQAALALDAGIPVIIHPIFPIAAFALPDPGQARHRLDSRHVFGVLIPQLPLDAQPHRRAMRARQQIGSANA